ncbi:Protein disulfide-isomerase-like protein [Hapsidospora chrysogenum ATCC 11550]|uniref:Protein disulfide-isomerase n=1 Tax=Hapsidospora chrysogenum (strain ATCC 11550 / CBS 779.69 / DSM 880 / IAM 14645 / JCM 23072 / IMI 49137) TaxID=857340 RepID=A0A086T567_HAPC1|nr:Protein disulfide-isomerase-like protein [Hapsidospora chrysogenum ATCC 11550]
MQQKRLAAGLLAAFAAFTNAEGESDVASLTKDTFADFIKANDLVLAEFFAPWCGHCKALAPEYEEAATSLKEKDIRLAKVDCTEEADLCKEYGVEGYPTLKVFRGLDNIAPYTGQRKAPAITSYMVKQSLPAVSVLDKDTLGDFKTADKVVLVAYISADDKASNETYTKVAEELRDSYLFGGVNDPAVAEAEGVKAPAIVLYKTFDEGKNIFTDKFDEDAIRSFANKAATPLIGEIGPDTYAGYMTAGIPLAYIFAETPEERTELGNAVRPIAEKYKGKINFATIDAKAYGAHAGNLNLKTDKFPCFAFQDIEKNQKFPFDQDSEITHDAIAKFAEDFMAGKIEPSIKSEPVPETQEGPVTVVVAKNYDQIVMDDTKDVLIEFYAPWCGHCKALAPKYDDLASQYAASEHKDKVVIAKVDATANDVPDDISGFPTIKLYPAGAKDSPVTYKGSRTVEDLISFIEEHGKHSAGISPQEEAEAAPAASEEAKKEDHDEL